VLVEHGGVTTQLALLGAPAGWAVVMLALCHWGQGRGEQAGGAGVASGTTARRSRRTSRAACFAGIASLRDISVLEPDIEDVVARLYTRSR
jgi:hypothetical protein